MIPHNGKHGSEKKAELHLGQVEETLGGLQLRGQPGPQLRVFPNGGFRAIL
jgi:hypothetical protein